jgi:hypothetical protein
VVHIYTARHSETLESEPEAEQDTLVQNATSRQEGEEVVLHCSYEPSQLSYFIFGYKQVPSGEINFLIRQSSSGQNARNSGYSCIFKNQLILSASPFQAYNWKIQPSISVISGRPQCCK